MFRKSILTVSACAVLILTQANFGLANSDIPFQSGRNRPIPAGTNVDSIDVFYNYLAPYGRWFTLGSYGLVWSPTVVGSDWSPYANGYWTYTDKGWTWESDDPWGWATCHYGRWLLDATYGWVWIPGTVWGPGWVIWRTGRGYIGWAPQPPEAPIQVDVPVSCYSFVEQEYFDNDDDDTPKHRQPRHRRPGDGGQYIHLPASAGADLRKWGPEIPLTAHHPGASGPAINSGAERPNRGNHVENGSNQTNGQYRRAAPGTEGNRAPAAPSAHGIQSGVERPARPAPRQDEPGDAGRLSGARPTQRTEETRGRQTEDVQHQQETHRQQAEEAGRRQAQETRRQQDAQQKQAEDNQRRQAEDARRQQEAQRQPEAQRQQADEANRRQAEEGRRQQEAQQQKQADESRRQQEAQQKQAEDNQRRQAEEAQRQQESQRQQAEESRRQQEAQRQQAEESRSQQEAKQRQAEESRRQKEAQKRQAEEAGRKEEAKQQQD